MITYVKVEVEIPATTGFAVGDLVGHCHLIVFVQVLVEALARVGLHKHIVGTCPLHQAQKECRREEHCICCDDLLV